MRLAGLRVHESRAALGAVIEAAQVAAVETDPVDHAGLEVGDQELFVPAVVSDVAERGAGVRAAVQRDRREQRRLVAVRRIEPVDRAGSAFTEHAGHPLRVVRGAVQAEGGGGSDIDVRRRGVVERDAEHLADLTGGHRSALRLVDPMLTLRGRAGRPQVEDAADRAVLIDRGQAVGALRGTGEPGGERFTGLQTLREAGTGGERQQQQSSGAGELGAALGEMV